MTQLDSPASLAPHGAPQLARSTRPPCPCRPPPARGAHSFEMSAVYALSVRLLGGTIGTAAPIQRSRYAASAAPMYLLEMVPPDGVKSAAFLGDG